MRIRAADLSNLPDRGLQDKFTIEVSILDALPIGVMSVRNGAIAFMNYTLRSLFAGAYASLAELAEAFPCTAGLADALERGEAVWVSIGDAVFHVDVAGRGEDGHIAVFVPLSYMDPKDPDLRELRELYTDFQEIFHNLNMEFNQRAEFIAIAIYDHCDPIIRFLLSRILPYNNS